MEDFSASGHTTVSTYIGNASSAVLYAVPEGCVLKKVSEVIPSENEGGLIPKLVNFAIDFILLGICLPVCFIVSFSTNIINMVVFYRHGLKERINMCLFSLSLLDLLYVTVSYGIKSSFPFMFAIGKAEEIGISNAFFFKSGLIGLIGLGTASQVTSAVIALERCLCIAHPLLVKNLMSTKKMATLLWSVVFVIVAMGILTGGMRFTVICVFNVEDNSTSLQVYPKQFYVQNMQLIHVLGGIVFGTSLPVLCVVCTTVCTVTIVVKMKKLSVWRETASSASESLTSRDLAVTRMIVATSILFIVCIVTSITARVAVNLIPGVSPGGQLKNLYSVLTNLYVITSVINSSFNFFVYYVNGSKFRETVHQLSPLCVWCFQKAHKGSKSPP